MQANYKVFDIEKKIEKRERKIKIKNAGKVKQQH